jgi:8-oxo-dGTP pyrophosphatase MutT (NUDIX family)
VVEVEVTIGLFAGIFDENGKVLLRKRKREDPDIPCPYEGDWELPGGTLEEENIWKAKDERIISEELAREIKEEMGITIQISFMPAMYPAVSISKEKRRIDFAFVIPIGTIKEEPTKGENIYVSPEELRELAERPEGQQLVSGWGKRMCRMALVALSHSPNPQYQKEAEKMLAEIQRK